MSRFIALVGLACLTAVGLGAQTPPPAPTATAVSAPAPPTDFPQTPRPAPAPPAAPPAVPATSTQAPPPAPGARPASATSPLLNVRVDVTISDTFGAAPTKKTLTVLVAERQTGRIRSSMSVQGAGGNYQPIGINVDVVPTLYREDGRSPDGRILLSLTVQYTPVPASLVQGESQKPASIDESLTAVLADGKPTLLSQSADPQGDRKVTLEVVATIER